MDGTAAPNEKPEMMTTREAAVMLRVSEDTVRRMFGDGRLASVKIGRARRIKRSDVRALMKATATVEKKKETA